MLKLIIKFITYFLIIFISRTIGFINCTLPTDLICLYSLAISLINTFIKPILTLIALPFNLITFGIASVFANMLCLVIANGIIKEMGGLGGFWPLLLLSIIVMFVDDLIAQTSYRIITCRSSKKTQSSYECKVYKLW